MSSELIEVYRAEALHHARLAERFAVAFVTGELRNADVMDEVRFHGRLRDRYRQQADALDPNVLVKPPALAWRY